MILILSGRSNLYITNSRTLYILKDFNLAKSNLSLSFMVWINIIFMFSILYRRYTLFFFLRVNPLTLVLIYSGVSRFLPLLL